MPAEFYEIQVLSADWIAILNRMINKFDKDGKSVKVELDPSGDMATYLLQRDVFPLAAVAAALGTSEAALDKAPKVILKAIGKQDDWQKPTVPYYGVA